MNPKIRHAILADEKLSYAKADTIIQDNLVDCSAGYNPYGPPPSAVKALSNLTPEMICEYPHGMFTQDAILKFWQAYVTLTSQNVLLTDGTIDGIYLANAAFSGTGAVLAMAPQFSDYTAHAKFMDIEYKHVYLKAEDAYRFDAEAMLARVDASLSLVYLDNPNNPTGQAIPLDAVRAMLARAAKYDVCVIVDEAYGDYMEQRYSAATLLGDFDNLIVLRTFSKGFGLAGLRAGYLLSSAQICEQLNKISNPYTMSQPARIAAAAVLDDHSFLESCRKSIAASKAGLRMAMGSKLKLAHTLDSCPICLISHENPAVDLERELVSHNILAYSGTSFDGLGINSVRLRVPHERHCDALFSAIRAISN